MAQKSYFRATFHFKIHFQFAHQRGKMQLTSVYSRSQVFCNHAPLLRPKTVIANKRMHRITWTWYNRHCCDYSPVSMGSESKRRQAETATNHNGDTPERLSTFWLVAVLTVLPPECRYFWKLFIFCCIHSSWKLNQRERFGLKVWLWISWLYVWQTQRRIYYQSDE